MRKRKWRWEEFVFYDKRGIEEHLEKMAKRGWLLEKITLLGWIYRKIEPQSLKFSVTYHAEGTDKQRTLYDFREHIGWKFLCSAEQMQILWNDGEEVLPMERVGGSELERLHESSKKRVVLPWSLFTAYGLLCMVFAKAGDSRLWGVLCDGMLEILEKIKFVRGVALVYAPCI